MPARRKAAAVAVVALAAPVLGLSSAAPAAAHGSMGGPVSRVAQCYAEGPEHPRSAACRAAVAAGGTQALYDWNGVRIGDANGRHRDLIPDGRLCSAGDAAFKGLDLPRADWPATGVRGGAYTFTYRVTAPHRGTFTVYVTKPGYDPARPLAWSDLDLARPVATATDPVASGGFYTFSGTLPERSGRHLLYAVWQRSDSPEAFYSCSDVTFPGPAGGGPASGGATAPTTPAPSASAPSADQIEAGADKSTVEHGSHGGHDGDDGHGDDTTAPTRRPGRPRPTTTPSPGGPDGAGTPPAAEPRAAGAGERLAATGPGGGSPYLAVGGAGALALGSAALFASVRRRAVGGGWSRR